MPAMTAINPDICRQARLARDARFDGRFFTAVKTTGIYCRPICAVVAPKERNVEYFATAVEAAARGYRPCLRCRPDSAPGSYAWKGVETTFERAVHLIDQGALMDSSLPALAQRLGVTDRYLRKLFQQHIGLAPLTYASYQQCLFAKQLLHQTSLTVTEVAFASGFNSLRRFTDCFKTHMGLTARQVRSATQRADDRLLLKLSYRPPYAWETLHQFLTVRCIEGLERIGDSGYGRTFAWHGARGDFYASHDAANHQFLVEIRIDQMSQLMPVVRNIRRVLDLDADTTHIESHLQNAVPTLPLIEGLRLPGTWSVFEAGVRAILGQQVSVAAAGNLTRLLVRQLGSKLVGEPAEEPQYLFPTAIAMAASDLAFLKMPQARRNTLREFARWYQRMTPAQPSTNEQVEQWLAIKGIGRWTVDYAAMRGQSHPDIWLGGDLGVKRTVARFPAFDPAAASPWRSYLTLQLWNAS